jgi:hypothetical protein
MIVISLIFIFCHLCRFILFDFQSLHDFLSLFVFVDHDVAHTQIRDYNGSQTKHVVCILVDNWLVISNGFIVLFENKENVSNVQFPSLMICTKLCGLSEQFLYNCIVLFVPIDFSLRHQHWNVLLQALIKLFQ